jgi:hypothetical protein
MAATEIGPIEDDPIGRAIATYKARAATSRSNQ